ncbi:efflux RND transporter periplasmic adaptor subunit [Geofilum sp. OHC36d9]|uniref:efflux RND transporter periplasmic adaptor subunit n=1 Tax=Geofilum sp. OHC36d9 TaxID=3458413 RepID=UPI004034CFCA
MKRINKKYLIYGTALIALSGIVFLFVYFKGGEPEYVFSTTKVERASISNTITATGTLEATNTVVVGTQVSGVIQKLYVDFNSAVKKGQLIAELDKSTLQSSLENAEADVEKAEANFEYQKSLLARNKVLYEKELLAKSEYDLILFNYKTSKAEVKSAKANFSRAERNLSYASIYSPIDGVVLNRAVEEGQTVAASMSTPELFTITNDLSTMEVEANIDEADIGQLEVGQRVEFTVDAFSERTFKGNVTEIRLQPNESSNVITYTAIITVSNPDLKLKPGMTASIIIYIEEANDVLVVKEKATSFTPDPQLLNDYMSRYSEKEGKPQTARAGKDGDRKPAFGPGAKPEMDDTHKLVWVKEGALIRPVVIEVGIDDGSNMAVISGLEEGATIVTSFELADNSELTKKDNSEGDQKSPFVQESPQRGGGPSGPPR